MTFKTLRENLASYIDNIITESSDITEDVTIRWNNLPGPRPSIPYIGLNMNLTYDGIDKVTDRVDDDGNRIIRQKYKITLDINSYGLGSDEILKVISKDLQRQSREIELNNLGLSLQSIGEMNDITDIIDQEVEPRYMMELNLVYSEEMLDNVDYIDDADINGETT